MDMRLLWSAWFRWLPEPPVETGGHKYRTPTEWVGNMSGTERARFPDLSLGRATFKNAAVEDMSAEQSELGFMR